MVEVIRKNNLYVIIALVVILGSIFAVHAYGTTDPAVFGHSAGEIGGGGGGTACAAGEVPVGSSCKILPTCTAGQVLSYNGASFSCKGSSIPTIVWKKVCIYNGQDQNDNQHVINCGSVGGAYGEDAHYSIQKTYGGYCLRASGQNLRSGVTTSCVENTGCTTEGQYCVKNFNEVGTAQEWIATIHHCDYAGWDNGYIYDVYNSAGTIYRCVRQ